MVDQRRIVDPGSGPGRGQQAGRSITELELGRWDQVRHHLLPRLVPNHRAGPLAFEPPLVPWLRSAPVRFDVGIDVTEGIVRLDRDLIRSLAVPPAEIWRGAMTNLAGRDRPPTLSVSGGPASFAIVAGGPWTTGLLLVPHQLALTNEPAPAPEPGQRPARHPGWPVSTTIVVAPHPEVLVVGRAQPVSSPGWPGGPEHRCLARETQGLAARLAEADGGPRLPLVPLRPAWSIREVLSRAGGFWNDVPVSEQPGRR